MLYHTFYIDITSLHHLITLYQRRYYDIAIWYYGHFPDTRRFKIHLVILNNFILVIILSRSDWILEENTLLDFTRTLFLLSLFDILPPFSFIGGGGGVIHGRGGTRDMILDKYSNFGSFRYSNKRILTIRGFPIKARWKAIIWKRWTEFKSVNKILF